MKRNISLSSCLPPLLLMAVTCLALPNPYPSDIVQWSSAFQGTLTRPVVAISAGKHSSFAIQDDGRVVAWGFVPLASKAFFGVKAISTESYGYAAMRADGTVLTDKLVDFPGSIRKVLALQTGPHHGIALLEDSTVKVWGQMDSNLIPSDLKGAVAVSAGEYHDLALTRDGTVYTWGTGNPSLLKVPVGLGNVKAIAAGYRHNAVVKDDGTVVVWGDTSRGQARIPAGLSGVVALSAGACHTAALKADGTVVSWGDTCQNINEIAIGASASSAAPPSAGAFRGHLMAPVGLGRITAIRSGAFHVLALRDDGTVVGWGEGRNGQTRAPEGLTEVTAIAAGTSHLVALRGDSTVRVTPSTDHAFGVASWDGFVPAKLRAVVAVAAGGAHTVALTREGRVVDWNQDGTLNPVPSNLDEVVAIAASWGHSVALRRGGTVVAWGEAIGDAASLVDSMTNVVAISATPMGIQALLADGSLLNVKLGTNAEIERRGGPTDSMRFVQVFPGWDGGGATEYYGMRADGRLWSVSGTGFPSEVSGNSPVRSISSNTFHSLALHRDGSVTAWGNSDYVNLTVPEGLGRIAQVAAAHRFSALLLDRSEPSEGVLPKAAMVDFPDGRYRIGLYDLLGNLVWSGEAVRTRQVWDMPFNRPGTWVVRTRTSSGWRSEKIVRLR